MVPVGCASRDENDIALTDIELLVSDADGCASPKNVLLVFYAVRMCRHAAARLHRELAQGEVRALFGSDQYLPRGSGASHYRFYGHAG